MANIRFGKREQFFAFNKRKKGKKTHTQILVWEEKKNKTKTNAIIDSRNAVNHFKFKTKTTNVSELH